MSDKARTVSQYSRVRAVAATLQGRLPVRRGAVMRLQVSAIVLGERTHVAWHRWDGKREALTGLIKSIRAGAAHRAGMEVALCATHPSVSAKDDVREDITDIVFSGAPHDIAIPADV